MVASHTITHIIQLLGVVYCAQRFWPKGILYSEKEKHGHHKGKRHRHSQSRSRSKSMRHHDDDTRGHRYMVEDGGRGTRRNELDYRQEYDVERKRSQYGQEYEVERYQPQRYERGESSRYYD